MNESIRHPRHRIEKPRRGSSIRVRHIAPAPGHFENRGHLARRAKRRQEALLLVPALLAEAFGEIERNGSRRAAKLVTERPVMATHRRHHRNQRGDEISTKRPKREKKE